MTLPERCQPRAQEDDLWPDACPEDHGAVSSLPCSAQGQVEPQPDFPDPVACPEHQTGMSLPRLGPTNQPDCPRDSFWCTDNEVVRTAPCNGPGPRCAPGPSAPTPLFREHLNTICPPSYATYSLTGIEQPRVGDVLDAQTPQPIDCNPAELWIVHELPHQELRVVAPNPSLETCCDAPEPQLFQLPAPTY